MGNHQPTQWMEVGLSTTNTMDGSRAFDNQHNGWEQLFRQLTQWHDGSGFLETKRQHNDQVAPTLAMVSPSWLGFVTAAMSVDELYTSTAPGYWSRVTVSVDIRNTIHAEPVDITGGDQSESAVYAAGTSMRNLSVRYSISSSPTTPASPTAVQVHILLSLLIFLVCIMCIHIQSCVCLHALELCCCLMRVLFSDMKL
eukprot:scpid81899/ scgid0441/ 